MANELNDVYKSVLAAAKLVVTEDGYVSSDIMGDKDPFIVGGKRLVIPISEQLRNPDRDSRIVFHPLRENPMQAGEPEVLAAYRAALNTRLNASIALLSINLIRLASSVAEHKKLNPDQSEYLSSVKNVDKKTFEDMAKVIDAMPLNQTKKAFVSIYLKKGASFNDKKYKYGGVVSFPLYEELSQEKGDVYGVKLRQKDRQAFIEVLKYIFPEIDTTNAYSAGSNSDVAPKLESIMAALKKLGECINTQVSLFTGIFDDPQEMEISADWVEAFDDTAALLPQIQRIPTQFGNDGREVAAPTTTAQVPVAEAGKISFSGLQQGSVPVRQSGGHVPQTNSSGGLSLGEAMRGMGGGGIGVNNARAGIQVGRSFGFGNNNGGGIFGNGGSRI